MMKQTEDERMSGWPQVMVAMPVKNDEAWLGACLAALLRMDYPHERLRFVFCYGLSTDNTKRIIEEAFAKNGVAYEILDERETSRPLKNALYLADTMNLLQAQLADEDYILYADADIVEIPKDLLKELIRTDKDIVAPTPMFEISPGQLVFYDTYVFRDLHGRDFTPVQRNANHPWLKQNMPVEMMSIGTLGLVTRQVAHRVHWGDPVPWLQYCLDAREKGFRVWTLPFLRIGHASAQFEFAEHVRVEEFVSRGVLPSSELKKVQTVRGRFRLQQKVRRAAWAAQYSCMHNIARPLAAAALRLAPDPMTVLMRTLYPNSAAKEFRRIAKESLRVSSAPVRVVQDKAKTILYVGTHLMRTYEECSLLHELGYTVLNVAPSLELDTALAERSKSSYVPYVPPDFESWLNRAREQVTPDDFDQLRHFDYRRPLPLDLRQLIEREFDTIIVVHDPAMIHNLIGFASHKRLIVRLVQRHQAWYALGMFNDFFAFPHFFVCPDTEEERAVTPDIARRLTVLPAHIDEKRLRPYTGEIPEILSACSNVTNWPKETRLEEFSRCVKGFPHLLTGSGNSNYASAVMLSYKDYVDALARYRVHLSSGYGRTAKYALKGFIVESMLCGAPVVTLSNLTLRRVFDNETNGFCSDDIVWLRKKIRLLLEDLDYAKSIGRNGRELARRLWSKDRAKKCWEFLLSHRREESVSWLRKEKESLFLS